MLTMLGLTMFVNDDLKRLQFLFGDFCSDLSCVKFLMKTVLRDEKCADQHVYPLAQSSSCLIEETFLRVT